MKKTQAAGRVPTPVQTSLVDEPPRTPAAGWDPYEVWRTRVLLPRAEEATAKPRAVGEPNVKPLLRSA
jgi:hypothetical protein